MSCVCLTARFIEM